MRPTYETRPPVLDTPGTPGTRHKHEFHALYWHYGKYGPQDVHLHPCFTEGCEQELVGEGRECDPHV